MTKEHVKAKWSLTFIHLIAAGAMGYFASAQGGGFVGSALTGGLLGLLLWACTERAIRTGIEAADEEHDLALEDRAPLLAQIAHLEHDLQEARAENAMIRFRASREEWTGGSQ